MSDIAVGDYVIVQEEKKNKLSPHFDPYPYVVAKRRFSEMVEC